MPHIRRFFCILCFAVICCVISLTDVHGGVFDGLLAKPVEADPRKPYRVEQTSGPWMILAQTFTGPTAEEDAHTLVIELRKTYKLHAFTFSKEFRPELDANDVIPTLNQYGQPKKMIYLHHNPIVEYSVLIGHFQSPEDNNFQKTLGIVKKLKPACLKNIATEPAEKSIFSMSSMSGAGPMAMAFPAPNPLLPPDYFKSVDPFIVRINSDSPYSLLNCQGKKTLKVATFSGRMEIRPEEIQKIETGKTELGESKLAVAGKLAADMCKALRQKGYEAYEYHDFDSSIVTIGSYEYFEVERPNGDIYRNPEILALATMFTRPDKPQTIIGIPFDGAPSVIDVPKKSR